MKKHHHHTHEGVIKCRTPKVKALKIIQELWVLHSFTICFTGETMGKAMVFGVPPVSTWSRCALETCHPPKRRGRLPGGFWGPFAESLRKSQFHDISWYFMKIFWYLMISDACRFVFFEACHEYFCCCFWQGKARKEWMKFNGPGFLSSLLAGTSHGLLCATPNPTESSQCWIQWIYSCLVDFGLGCMCGSQTLLRARSGACTILHCCVQIYEFVRRVMVNSL